MVSSRPSSVANPSPPPTNHRPADGRSSRAPDTRDRPADTRCPSAGPGRTSTVVAGRHRTRADNPAPFQSEMTLRGWLWERWRWPKSAPSRIVMGFSRGAASRPRFGAVSSESGRLGPKKGRFRAMWNEGFALPGSTAVRTLTRGLGSGRSRSPGHRERPRESGGNGQPHLARASALVSSANPRAGRGHLLANEDKARHFLPE